MPSMLPFTLALLSFAASSYQQATATISAPTSAASASGVSNALNQAFAGFGIEPSNLYSFTGGSITNELSVNLLQNLANYAGAPPHLRIGGNTADQMIYNPSFTGYEMMLKQNPTGQGAEHTDKFIFGPMYWTALNRFPKGTPITFGLSLAYQGSDYIQNIVMEAKACLNGLKNVNLYSFEIGNEPDLYLANQFRSAPWDGKVYTQQYLERASAVYQQVLKPAGLPAQFFEAPNTASTIGTTFAVDDLQQAGIMNGVNGSSTFLAAWNQHDYYYFVDVSTYTLTLEYLQDLKHTEEQFSYWAQQVQAAIKTGVPYYLREMANAGPIGVQGVSDTFGAALWTLNFFCYAASVGVESVQMHMTDNSYASAWQPGELNGQGPHIRPSYYAFAAMAQLLGAGNGTTQIAAVTPNNIPSNYADYVRTYAAYTNGELSAVVLINSMNSREEVTSKGSVTFKLSFPNAKGETLYISTLTAAGGDSVTGTTWNGLSFQDSGDGTASVSNSAVQTVVIGNDGSASVTVRDSQAVIANVGFLLGSRAVKAGTASSGTSNSKKSGSSGPTSNSATSVAITSVFTTAAAMATSAAPVASTTSRSDAELGRRRPKRWSVMFMVAMFTFIFVVIAARTFG
ncbi:glycoside hydrolase family 79 protein [Venturia nashicola]|uniref:Glycoside hydrolase family 79 protein n=1 Tax=Venturia nashicola TaxID=86259 RepID=A0A4Z1P434_9PEZI|nr:glycoside hydrolase family 79 protein [Venturia nashicola]